MKRENNSCGKRPTKARIITRYLSLPTRAPKKKVRVRKKKIDNRDTDGYSCSAIYARTNFPSVPSNCAIDISNNNRINHVTNSRDAPVHELCRHTGG